MYTIPDWPNNSPIWVNEAKNLLLEDDRIAPHTVTLDEIEENSNRFPIDFPIQTVRCKIIKNHLSKAVLETYINSVYPVLHENVLRLCADFLLHKRKFGNAPERELYKNMSLLEFIDRLVSKRAVLFVSRIDDYVLLDGTKGFGEWETIGTEAETDRLNLRKYMSYDEIKLSAFLSVSSYTDFINNGNRYNRGDTNRTNLETNGIIVGLIGARLKKPKVMEYQEIVISKDQNTEALGYGTQFAPTVRSLFAGFYGEVCFTYENGLASKQQEPNRFVDLENGVFFDNNVYCKRISLSIDTLLLEANQRAKEKGQMAFIHVVGIGLGVWKVSSHQTSLFLDTFAKRIQALDENLHSVSDIVFGYFGPNATSGGYKNGDSLPIEGHPNRAIRIFFSQRDPHTKLTGEDEGKLLVVSYAWDGNALPGNEFWTGLLSGSGDSAAASSTQVAELHNPHINPRVCSQNLRIATPKGVVSYFDYRENVKQNQ